MLPEEKAKVNVGRMLREAGRSLVSCAKFKPCQSIVAVCGGILQGMHEKGYVLFLDGKAICVLETKAAHITQNDRMFYQAEQFRIISAMKKNYNWI